MFARGTVGRSRTKGGVHSVQQEQREVRLRGPFQISGGILYERLEKLSGGMHEPWLHPTANTSLAILQRLKCQLVGTSVKINTSRRHRRFRGTQRYSIVFKRPVTLGC